MPEFAESTRFGLQPGTRSAARPKSVGHHCAARLADLSETTMPRMAAREPLQRFDTLDALRGVAALCVLILHCSSWTGKQSQFGYLAVDFFFCLSGFILAHTYDHRLRQGMTPATFLRGRIRRLYPLYLMGAFLGLLVRFGESGASLLHSPAALLGLTILVSLTCLMMPFPFGVPERAAWPLNSPSWSLSFELLVNVVYSVWLWRLTRPSLLAAIVAGWICLVWATVALGSLEGGDTTATLPMGFARVAFSFPLGVFIARLYGDGRLASIPARHPFLPAMGLLLILFCPPFCDRKIIEICSVTVALPFVLVLGIRARRVISWQAGSRFLGRLSYPLYILHYPIFLAVKAFGPMPVDSDIESFAVAGAASLLALLVASLATRPEIEMPFLRARL
ncbi:acyltransferase family protein [Methylobacterium sp. M6A4_1b]